MARPQIAALASAVLVAQWPLGARAFELGGHEVIEAAAYKRMLAMEAVPGAGIPAVSGRALLASLMATGVLRPPPCFDREHPGGDCDPASRLALPLLHWPVLGSGTPDLVIDRQLGQRGQCQHFMARTDDGLSAVDPRLGVPGDLATTAYSRCIQVMGVGFDGMLRDPYLARWRVAGTYVLMHGIEDSFSAAHVHRDEDGRIVHLLSWTLIDWPKYLVRGHLRFPAATHHAISDSRDAEYIRRDARSRDGTPCATFLNPYALPEECLTESARAAAGAVVDFLILTYRLRTSASAEHRQATLFDPSQPAAPLWLAFMRRHVPSVAASVELPPARFEPPPRADLFLGAQIVAGSNIWGTGAWVSHLLVGPALPFVINETLTAGFVRESSGDLLVASGGLGLLLPLVRRFALGVTPAGLRVACGTAFEACTAEVAAQLGELLIPLGSSTWLGLEGPRYSWRTRSLGETWLGLAVGWSHERVPRPEAPGPAAVASWQPPRPDEVTAFRRSRSTRTVYVAATAWSTDENQFVGAGLEWRLDRDRWDRRAGVAPGLQLELDGGAIDAATQGGAVALAPTLRAYALPGRLALTGTPALVRAGAIAGRPFAVDVAARAGLVLALGRLEISVDSPPLSYVARSRWHALPLTARLGIWFD